MTVLEVTSRIGCWWESFCGGEVWSGEKSAWWRSSSRIPPSLVEIGVDSN